MRVIGRAEDERKRSTGRDHRPVGGGIEPVPPDVRTLDLTPVEMHHSRVKLGWSKLLRDLERCRSGLLASFAYFFSECPEGVRDVRDVNVIVGRDCRGPNIVFHTTA